MVRFTDICAIILLGMWLGGCAGVMPGSVAGRRVSGVPRPRLRGARQATAGLAVDWSHAGDRHSRLRVEAPAQLKVSD